MLLANIFTILNIYKFQVSILFFYASLDVLRNVIYLFLLGSGKTYTMQPLPLKASQDILRLMNHTFRNQGFQLFVSFFEIYGGKIFDLLNDRK